MLFVAAFAAAATIASPDALRSALATSASALFEATPFFVAVIALARFVPSRQALAYLGCGCGTGPSARSLTATAVAWLVFGPVVAIGRFVAAIAVARLTASACSPTRLHEPPTAPTLLDDLAAMLPAALLAGAVSQLAALVDLHRLAPIAQLLGGAALGFA
ncbi:MAG: hypothetical protein WB615_00125, partial [Candidatus Tumulicola sp.]